MYVSLSSTHSRVSALATTHCINLETVVTVSMFPTIFLHLWRGSPSPLVCDFVAVVQIVVTLRPHHLWPTQQTCCASYPCESPFPSGSPRLPRNLHGIEWLCIGPFGAACASHLTNEQPCVASWDPTAKGDARQGMSVKGGEALRRREWFRGARIGLWAILQRTEPDEQKLAVKVDEEGETMHGASAEGAGASQQEEGVVEHWLNSSCLAAHVWPRPEPG